MKSRTLLVAVTAVLLITSLTACEDETGPGVTPDQGVPPDISQADISTDSAPPDQAAPDQLMPDQLAPDQLIPDQLIPDLPPPTCTDGKQNGDETDMDCGGATCPACADT